MNVIASSVNSMAGQVKYLFTREGERESSHNIMKRCISSYFLDVNIPRYYYIVAIQHLPVHVESTVSSMSLWEN